MGPHYGASLGAMMLRTLALLPIFVLLSGEQALVLMAPLPLTLLLVEAAASRRQREPGMVPA